MLAMLLLLINSMVAFVSAMIYWGDVCELLDWESLLPSISSSLNSTGTEAMCFGVAGNELSKAKLNKTIEA